MTATNAKTLKLGVYLHVVDETLSYARCKCGWQSGAMPTAMAGRAGRKHKCVS